MTATIYCTLRGFLCGRHPDHNLLVAWDGRVRQQKSGKWVKESGEDAYGYYRIKIRCSDGLKRTKKIHRLVAETFIPNPKGKPTVDHNDRNTHNNAVSNLSWATIAEQNENRECVLSPKHQFGFRYKDNPVLWNRIRMHTTSGALEKQAAQKKEYIKKKRLDPVWLENERERCREKNRRYRARKKAERSAQPS